MARKPWRKYPWDESFTFWLRYRFAAEQEKSIQALVYVGAAFLVIIVGLRGLGDLSGVSFIPRFLLNDEGKIESNIVMMGLLVEFIMLCLLAAVSFFSPKDRDDDLQSSINRLSTTIEMLSEGVPNEVGKKLVRSAEKTSETIETFLEKELQILEKFKTQTEERILHLNKDMTVIRENISRGIVDSTKQVSVFLKNEKDTISGYNSLIQNMITETKLMFKQAADNLKEGLKQSTSETKKELEREKETVDQFYSINARLVSKSTEEFREVLKNYSVMMGALINDARSAYQNVSKSLTEEVKKSSEISNSVFERERHMIDKFYKINSELISRSGDEFRGVLKSYNDMMEKESERLSWLSANQLSPTEYMQKVYKSNDRLIMHLENIDNTLKVISTELGAADNQYVNKHSLYKRIKIRWQRIFNQMPS